MVEYHQHKFAKYWVWSVFHATTYAHIETGWAYSFEQAERGARNYIKRNQNKVFG